MRKFKYAISNIGWDREFDEEMYVFLKEAGFVGLEIAPTRIFEESPYEKLDEARAFKENIAYRYGLEVCSMQSIWFGKMQNIFANKEQRDELIEYTKKAIDFAEAIGCPNLVFGCPRNRKMESIDEKNLQVANDFFNEIGDYASNKNVVIALEPNPAIYDTNFLNTTSEAIEFVRSLNNDAIKINCDLGAVIYNEENIDIILENIDIVNHIHISEPNLVSIVRREMHRKLFDALEVVGYGKYVSIEMRKSEIEVVEEVIEYVGNI